MNFSIEETSEYESSKLYRIHDHITDWFILHSKAHWYDEGERASKYFLSLKKRNNV